MAYGNLGMRKSTLNPLSKHVFTGQQNIFLKCSKYESKLDYTTLSWNNYRYFFVVTNICNTYLKAVWLRLKNTKNIFIAKSSSACGVCSVIIKSITSDIK